MSYLTLSMTEMISEFQKEQAFHLTAIYNQHGFVEDAEATLGYIEPNSIVFREGIMSDAGRSLRFAELRLQEGAYIGEAGRMARQQAWRAANSGLHNSDYRTRLFTGLVEKNCVMYPADFIGDMQKELFAGDSDWITRDILRMFRERSPRVIERLVDADTALTELWSRENRIREEAAVARIKDVFEYSDIRKETHLSRDAYVIYGALHRRSLTQRLGEAGIAVSAIKHTHSSEQLETMPDLATLTDMSIDERRERIRELIARAWNNEPYQPIDGFPL